MSMSQVDRIYKGFEDYRTEYQSVEMTRTDGILEVKLHTLGDSLRWSLLAHHELERAFLDIGRDRDNEVVILTGAGQEFCGPAIEPGQHPNRNSMTAQRYDAIYWESKQILPNLLSIAVPVIAAINGPAVRHSELPLVSDIVLASEDAYFQDTAHFPGGMVPGDGMHIVMPMLMGATRAKYFLLTGQKMSAAEARDIGLVNEILPKGQVLDRAYVLARELLKQPPLVRRYTRTVLTEELRCKMNGLLGYGLILEGMARMKE